MISFKNPTIFPWVPFRIRCLLLLLGYLKGRFQRTKKSQGLLEDRGQFVAVGNILRTNKLLKKIPCYRVVRSDGG